MNPITFFFIHLNKNANYFHSFDQMATSRLRIILGDFNINTVMDGIHEERRVAKIFRYPEWNLETNVIFNEICMKFPSFA